jgi:hypothetical protein
LVIVVVLAGLIILGAGIGFAASYVDDPPDSTCGSVFHPQESTPDCERVIPIRLGVTGALLMLGAGIVLAAAVRPSPRRSVSIIAASSLFVAVVIVIVNEFIRTGGLWAAG